MKIEILEETPRPAKKYPYLAVERQKPHRIVLVGKYSVMMLDPAHCGNSWTNVDRENEHLFDPLAVGSVVKLIQD